MKQCTYCGKEYPDEASICYIDENPLRNVAPERSNSPEDSQPRRIELTDEEKLGCFFLLLILALTICISLLELMVFSTRVSGEFLFAHYVRIAIELALFYAVWIGKEWARWLAIFFFILGWVFSVYGLFVYHSMLAFFLSIFALIGFTSLAFSKKIHAFLLYQRQRR